MGEDNDFEETLDCVIGTQASIGYIQKMKRSIKEKDIENTIFRGSNLIRCLQIQRGCGFVPADAYMDIITDAMVDASRGEWSSASDMLNQIGKKYYI